RSDLLAGAPRIVTFHPLARRGRFAGKSMPNRVIVGAQWGDEGKAKIVDFLTEEADLVIRFQGGANAGHTVVVGDEKFVLRLMPAGIMHPGKQCVIGNGVVLDPAHMLQEIEEVRAKGIELDGRLWVAANAPVVLT